MSVSGGSAPALTPRIWGVLLRAEWFKARKRLAFWVALGMFAVITFMTHAESFFDARRKVEETYALPEVWSRVLGENSVILLIFASITVILLVSSEFSWRTGRQNVIDGLSKTQWFWGKAWVLPLLGLLFVAVQVAIGGVMGLVGTDPAAASGPLFPASVLRAMGALLLSFLAVGSLAFLISTAVRSSGAAMAVWFFWVAFGEQLLIGILGRFVPSVRPALRYLPFQNAQSGLGFHLYDRAALQRFTEAAAVAGQPAPRLPDLSMVLWVDAGWAILFMAAAYVWFVRRDL